MTIVKIHKLNKMKLKGNDERTFDEIVTSLIDEVEQVMVKYELDDTMITSIKLNEETISRLEEFRLTNSESLENIIIRMMLVAKSLNTNDNQ